MPHANHSVGLRTVAVLEAAKGILALLLGVGVLALMHMNLDDVAEWLTEILRVNPEGKLSNLFFKTADRATDKTLWVLAIGALVDAGVRFVEAFGLWREREWAQWVRAAVRCFCTCRGSCTRCCAIRVRSSGG